MATLRDRPYPSMNFTVDLGTGVDEGPEAGLLEVIFPEARIQINEYRNGSDKTGEATKTLGPTHYGNLLLRRGAIGSLNWYQWWNEARNGNPTVARNVVVRLLDEDRGQVVLTWIFFRALPATYQCSPLNALSGDTVIENLELAFERMEME
jgi:phage tail-like protein